MERIQEEKKLLRSEIRKAITESFIPQRAELSHKICAYVSEYAPYREAKTVFLFIGTAREIDTLPLLEDAWQSGKTVCVPRCIEGNRMALCRIDSMDALQIGSYGILEPAANCPTLDHSEIEFALIPCLACTRDGKRLGKGGGYYDRFFELYDGPSAMLCPEMLIQNAVPTLSHDKTVQPVITELGIFPK